MKAAWLEQRLSRFLGRAKYQAADRSVLALHRDVGIYADVSANAIVKLSSKDEKRRLSFIALHVMESDLLALHRAGFRLCRSGWAYAAPILLRTQVDILLNAGAITTRGPDADYMGFKYLFVSTKKYLQEPGISKGKKARERDQVQYFIASLSASDQAKARAFLAIGKVRPYWYSPEFASPRALIKAISVSSVQELYDSLSGAAHGGMVSLREWRDTPDDQEPTPRADSAAQNRALAFYCKLLLDFTHLRRTFLQLPADQHYAELVQRHQGLRSILDDSLAEAMRHAKVFAQGLAAQRQQPPPEGPVSSSTDSEG